MSDWLAIWAGFAAMLILSGCSLGSFFRAPEPQTEVVTVSELYCPPIKPPRRPMAIDVQPPAFVVLTPDDPRLQAAGAMICVDSMGYERLSLLMQEVHRYTKEVNAALDYWENSTNEQGAESE